MAKNGRPHGAFLWLRAETFIHVGVGQQSSLIDLPFAREGATGFPYIPGSGMKGALRDSARLALGWTSTAKDDPSDKYFGTQIDAGPILVSDARLAFLPVRSLGSSYRYVTSDDLMYRLERDLDFVGIPATPTPTVSLTHASDYYLGPQPGNLPKLFLEEFAFARENDAAIDGLINGLPNETCERVRERVAILSGGDFDYFASHGLHVRMRNALDPATKTVSGTALWSEESLPPDTLMYVVLTPRLTEDEAKLTALLEMLRDPKKCGGYFQVGGNETVGEGWFKILPPPAAQP